MLGDFLLDNSTLTEQVEIKTSIIKIRGKILIYGNVVYQIRNITSIGLVKRTTVKQTPKWYWSFLSMGVMLLFVPNLFARIFGALIIALGVWLLYQHHINKISEKYGMTIFTNSGDKRTFVSRSEDFIKKVILVLYNVMNAEQNESINFNFDPITMDRSMNLKIGQNISSPIVGGSVIGDIVNEI